MERKEDFLTCQGDFIRAKYSHIGSVKGGKWLTFKAALNIFKQQGFRNIVETGTMRMKDDGGGSFTLFFGEFLNTYPGHLWTVDISSRNLQTSMECTKMFAHNITYVCSDSIKFLQRFDHQIDLLFLDSADCDPTDTVLARFAQMHQMKEFLAAEDKLHNGSILLMDDSYFPSGGKTYLLKNFLIKQRKNWMLICDNEQTLFVRDDSLGK